MYDLIIRGGDVVDGRGGPAYSADVAINGQEIIAIGQDLGPAKNEIDATGKYVTPGFVDIHTHYDGQATWDQEMAPSSWHGVTTVVMGNCGVGFAPAAPDRHNWLIGLMEGVEDIPGAALSEGLLWGWESFAEYMDALEILPRTVDVAAQVPHGAVRAYVMGERGAANEPPTETDIARMSAIVEDGLRAGALGFSTSRTILHKSVDGVLVPGTTATKEELIGIGRAMGRVGHGVFEMASDLEPDWNEFEWMGDLSRETGLPVTFTALQSILKALSFDEQLAHMRDQNRRGANIYAQISMRGTGLLLGWQASFHPFSFKPSWQALESLSWEEKLVQLKTPEIKARILAEASEPMGGDLQMIADLIASGFNLQFEMNDNFNYEPEPSASIQQRADAGGVSASEYAYNTLMANDGSGFIYFPLLNYLDGNLDFVEPVLRSDDCLNSLSDGGAHCGTICDAAAPTFMLEYWVRDRAKGTITIEQAIKRQCHDTAVVYGLEDRGVIAPGYLADLNIIDLAKIKLNAPYVAFDLPAGGKRLLQTADGYIATIKSGQVTFRNGSYQGVNPGGVIRGPQPQPAVAASPQAPAIG